MRMLVPPNPTKVACTFHDLPSFCWISSLLQSLNFFFFPSRSLLTGKLISIVFEVRQWRVGSTMLPKLEGTEPFPPWTVAQSANKCTICSSGQRDCLSRNISVHTDHKWAGEMFYSEH